MRRSLDRALAARKNHEEGFTLIELLIVIVILGVLAAIVVFSVSGITDTGKAAACKANFETSTTAIEAYYANSNPNTYPANLSNAVPQYLASDPSAATVDASIRVTYARTSATVYTLSSGTACTLSH